MAKFAAKLLQNSKIEVLEDQGIGVIVVISQGGFFHELNPGVNNLFTGYCHAEHHFPQGTGS